MALSVSLSPSGERVRVRGVVTRQSSLSPSGERVRVRGVLA